MNQQEENVKFQTSEARKHLGLAIKEAAEMVLDSAAKTDQDFSQDINANGSDFSMDMGLYLTIEDGRCLLTGEVELADLLATRLDQLKAHPSPGIEQDEYSTAELAYILAAFWHLDAQIGEALGEAAA